MNVSIGTAVSRFELNWRDEGGVRIRLPKPGAVGGSVVF